MGGQHQDHGVGAQLDWLSLKANLPLAHCQEYQSCQDPGHHSHDLGQGPDHGHVPVVIAVAQSITHDPDLTLGHTGGKPGADRTHLCTGVEEAAATLPYPAGDVTLETGPTRILTIVSACLA